MTMGRAASSSQYPAEVLPAKPRRSAQRVVALLGLSALLLPLPGCQSVTGSSSQALVRLIDSSPDAGGVDVYLGGGVFAYNLGLGTVTSYVAVTPGTYGVSTDAAGTRTVLASASGSFATNGQYTVLIGDAASGYAETILKDQSTAAPAGQVSLRVLDQADRAGAVDLYLVPAGASLATQTAVLTNVTFGRNTGYFNVPAGTYSLVALPTGTVPTATGSTTYSGTAVAYSGGSARTLVLLDPQVTTASGLQVVVANDYESVATGS